MSFTTTSIGKVIDCFDKTLQDKNHERKHEPVVEIVQEEQL